MIRVNTSLSFLQLGCWFATVLIKHVALQVAVLIYKTPCCQHLEQQTVPCLPLENVGLQDAAEIVEKLQRVEFLFFNRTSSFESSLNYLYHRKM
jgi:hypothetical protein